MKVLAFIMSVFISVSVQAKIWRVNNNIGIAADFTTLKAAHDGASSGDTIYVEGSNTSYGILSSTKQLFIIGPGYFLDMVPNSQVGQLTAKVGDITLNKDAAGTVIMGIDFSGNGITVYCNDVVIRKNRFSTSNGNEHLWTHGMVTLGNVNNNSTLGGVSNIVIAQNHGVAINAHKPSNGILITNNVIGFGAAWGENNGNACLEAGQNTALLIQNNIIRRGKVSVYGSTVTNNIMVLGFFTPNNNLYSNNISNSTQFGTDNGNQSNIPMTDVFTNTGAPDEAYKLKVGSPAIGAGYGSTSSKPIDCGIFSGNMPYIVAGQVNMPVICFFNNQPIGSNTDPIKVTVKVKAAGN